MTSQAPSYPDPVPPPPPPLPASSSEAATAGMDECLSNTGTTASSQAGSSGTAAKTNPLSSKAATSLPSLANEEKRTLSSHRNSVSCLSCRASKVRCLIGAGGKTGEDCQRCQSRGQQCVIPISGRSSRKKNGEGKPNAPHASVKAAALVKPLERLNKKPRVDVRKRGADAEAELRFDDPLALLAHASSRQFAEAEQMHDDLYAEGGSSSGDEPLPTWRERNRATTYHSYFRHCMFVVKPDVKHSYNPHLLGMVSDSLGARLHAHFMSTYNDAVDLLDPVLHTVDAIRASSALLATVVYLLAARAMPTADLPDGEDLCARLEAHINKVLLPAVLVEDLRSLELVQAFLLLSLYHPPTPRAYEDRSWSHIGHAIRIASSLSVASVLAHKKTIASHRHRSRHVRNYERTWYLLHIHEHFTSTFLARQFVLGDDATLAYAPQWVTEEVNLSLPGDRVIVKLLALKQLLHRSRAQDEVLLISKKSPIPTWKMQFNHRRSQAELSSWKAASVGGSGGEGRGDNLTAASETTASETCTELYYQYARVFLACLASKGSTASVEILSDMYDACLLFLSHLSNANVRYAPNVVYVTGAYVATIALRLSEMGHDFSAKDHLHVSVWNLVDKFRQAGNVTRYRDCCASAYANLVESLLKSSQRKRSIGENGEEQQNGTNGVHSQAPSQPSASSRSKATPTDCNATHGEVPSANLAQQLPFFGLDANFTNLLDPFLTDNLGAIHPDLM